MAHKNNYYTIHACIIYKVHAYSPFYKCWWAFGSNHQKSKHFQMPRCVLTCSPNIWVVDWEMWFSADHWVPGAHSLCVSHLFQEGVCDSSVWFSGPSFKSPACRACEFTCPPIPTKMGALCGKIFLPDICWMNEVLTMHIPTHESNSVPCTGKKHNKYWMNIYVCEQRDSDQLRCITQFFV